MDLSVLCCGFVATASTSLEYLAILVSVYLHILRSDGRVAPHCSSNIWYFNTYSCGSSLKTDTLPYVTYTDELPNSFQFDRGAVLPL